MSGTLGLDYQDPMISDFVNSIRDNGEKSGPNAVSPAGATGTMQVMPGTASSPGFGIPPSNGSPQDTARVGEAYARAMLARYSGNQILASAAYNAGPGRVDQWISQFGDPRTGSISNAEWQSKIPFDETRNYVGRVVGGTGLSGNPLSSQAPQVEEGSGTQTSPGNPLSVSNQAQAIQALRLMSMLVPNGHRLTAVDYNPFAKGMPGAG